ncbi:MAG: sulfurtransferase TusA family protein [Candidatus Bathyarchaeota archaeon]|nr:sulfurtransferase TusA family protein [Candidatus Bathyarchaeota archaeon]
MKRENLDARDKTCPWPVLLTKEKLKGLKSGDILEVTVNYQPAKENVERVATTAGNKVLEVKEEKNQFTIVIQKK